MIASACLLAASSVPFAPAAAAPTCFGKPATIVGPGPTRGPNQNEVHGTQKNDVIVGSDWTDFIYGKGGRDLICAGDNHWNEEDLVFGGRGNDKINGQATGDYLYGGPGEDLLLGGGGFDDLLPGMGADVVRGGRAGDVLRDQIGGWDRFFGGGGPDELMGGPGNDILRGGSGSDRATYSEQCCEYDFDEGRVVADLATGTATTALGTDELFNIENLGGTSGDDVLAGDEDDNWLWGEEGSDELDGREGQDTLNGGEGVDTCSNGETFYECESP